MAASHVEHTVDAAQCVDQIKALLGADAVQWIVVRDGHSHEFDGMPIADIIVDQPRQFGVSCARNMGLSHARGEYVIPLDNDDALVPEGVASALKHLQADSQAQWLGASRVTMDSEATEHAVLDLRSWSVGELAQEWTSPFVFHPNCVVVSRQALLSIGGWPGLGVGEDLLMVLLLSEYFAGLSIPDALTRYRRWEGQTVASAHYQAQEKPRTAAFIAQVINAKRRMSGRDPVQRLVR